MRADQRMKLIEHRANLARALQDMDTAMQFIENLQLNGTGVIWGHLESASTRLYAAIAALHPLTEEGP